MNTVKSLTPWLLIACTLPVFAGEKIDKTLPADDISQVHIENMRGDINIVGWQQKEVLVKGELDDQTEQFIFEKQGAQMIIHVKVPRHFDNHDRGDGTTLAISIPQGVKVFFNGVSSDISMKNTQGSAEIKTVSGDVKVSQLRDYIDLSTVSGDVKSDDLSGKVSLSTVSGEIEDKNSTGRVQLKTVSGSIETKSQAEEVFLNTVSGDIEAKLGKVNELVVGSVSGDVDTSLALNNNGIIKLSSVSGDFTLKFDEKVQASFRLSSSAGGDFINKITDDKQQEPKYGPGAKLVFETGNANGSVRASTVSGNVRLLAK